MKKTYAFERTSRFTKSLKRYSKNDEKKKKAIIKTFTLLLDNPSHPSLNLELINSKDKVWTVRINLSDRIFLSFEANDIILLIDIGSHDLYKQY